MIIIHGILATTHGLGNDTAVLSYLDSLSYFYMYLGLFVTLFCYIFPDSYITLSDNSTTSYKVSLEQFSKYYYKKLL